MSRGAGSKQVRGVSGTVAITKAPGPRHTERESMATLIKADGSESEIPTPTPKQLRELCGGFPCFTRTSDGRAMFVHDEGLLLGLPKNEKATELYYGWTPIVGVVVVFNEAETKADREDVF